MSFNILDKTFLVFAFVINFLGIFLNYFQRYAPAFVCKAVFYGNFAYKGSEAKWIRHIEFCKSYFRHIYIYTSVITSPTLVYMILVYFFNVKVNEHVRIVLHAFLQEDEPVSVVTALTAMLLLTILSWKRFYETKYVQVFAQSSKMNVLHLLLTYVHYGFLVMAIIGKGPLFCGTHNRKDIIWTDFNSVIIAPCTLIFLWATYEQLQSNIILANLRKNKETGSVVTEEYGMPRGRLFRYVSSPHRLCEIILYVIYVILLQTKTSVCVLVWVLSNQIQAAIAAHLWYKKTFKNYPAERYAIFPYFL